MRQAYVGDGQWLVHNANCLFRGTTVDYAGNKILQSQRITPTSIDPAVATVFATQAQHYGQSVVHSAAIEDLIGIKIIDTLKENMDTLDNVQILYS